MAKKKMVKSNYGKTYKKKTYSRKKKKYTDVEKFAYNLGLVQKGLKNPDSRVTESYQNGLKVQETKKRKSLF